MKKIQVKTQSTYNAYIGKDNVFELTSYIKRQNLGNYAIVITNKTIYGLYKKHIPRIFKKSKTLRFKLMVLPDSERIKSLFYVTKILNLIGNLDFTSRIFFVAWGGGVIGDLTGFIASIYKRGCPYIQIPTTLLAQIDSSIGGKTAVDLKTGKNLVGSFWQPSFVLSDIKFLATLTPGQIRQGLAESVKYGIIKDKELFKFLQNNYKKILQKDTEALTHLIHRCAKIKAEIVAKDEREEKGIRTILNFGHTVGHGIEAASNYTICHGSAVAAGIIAAIHISKATRTLADKRDENKITTLMKNIGFNLNLKIKLPAVITALKRDKKFLRGKIRMVLLKRIGEVMVKEDIKIQDIRQGIELITN